MIIMEIASIRLWSPLGWSSPSVIRSQRHPLFCKILLFVSRHASDDQFYHCLYMTREKKSIIARHIIDDRWLVPAIME